MIRDKSAILARSKGGEAIKKDDRIVAIGEAQPVASAGGAAARGQITACAYSTGIVTVRLAGTTTDVQASQGPYGPHVIGDNVAVVKCGGTPAYEVITHIAGARHYEPISLTSPPTAVTGCS
jgi:hypothetical protein